MNGGNLLYDASSQGHKGCTCIMTLRILSVPSGQEAHTSSIYRTCFLLSDLEFKCSRHQCHETLRRRWPLHPLWSILSHFDVFYHKYKIARGN